MQFKSSVNTAVGALQDQRKQQAGETVSHVLTETGQKRKVQEERNHIARGTTTVTSTCMLGRTMHETGTSMCMSRQAAPLRVRQSVPAAGSASNFELLLSTIVYYRRRQRSPPPQPLTNGIPVSYLDLLLFVAGGRRAIRSRLIVRRYVARMCTQS